jgi:hypothetical protein
MKSEEILGLQFSVHWSTCFPIPGKRFPITHPLVNLLPNPWKAISYHLIWSSLAVAARCKGVGAIGEKV